MSSQGTCTIPGEKIMVFFFCGENKQKQIVVKKRVHWQDNFAMKKCTIIVDNGNKNIFK